MSVVVLIVFAGAQRLIGLGRNVLFCGLLEDEQLGRWSLAYSFLLLAAPLVVLGIPGSFGRYVEHFRHRGHLRVFLRRTLMVSGLLAAGALVGMLAIPRQLAQLLFDDARQWPLIYWLVATLLAVLLFNVISELLTALRLVRVVSIMQLVSSTGFAAIGILLLYRTAWREVAVIAAYGGGMLIAAIGGAIVLAQVWRTNSWDEPSPEPSAMWSKLLPFAAWVWLSNLVSNLFEAADQFMLKHLTGVPPAVADALVGQYYSSRVIPVLMISLAVMLASSLLPHLTRDWERGRRDEVQRRMNRAVKLVATAFTGAGAIVLLAAPLLFTWLLRGKYDAGLTVLPGTLTYCVWYGIACVAHTYLLCAEDARAGSLALAMGLAVNVGLNYWLAPTHGLAGVVTATAAANLLALVLIYGLSWRRGMHWDRGAVFASLLPLSLCLGSWHAGAVATLAGWVAWREGWLADREDQAELRAAWASIWRASLARLRRPLGVST